MSTQFSLVFVVYMEDRVDFSNAFFFFSFYYNYFIYFSRYVRFCSFCVSIFQSRYFLELTSVIRVSSYYLSCYDCLFRSFIKIDSFFFCFSANVLDCEIFSSSYRLKCEISSSISSSISLILLMVRFSSYKCDLNKFID